MNLRMLALLGLLPLQVTLWSADAQPPNISVTGTAVTEVAPDLIQWQIEVKNSGPLLANVAEKHASKVSAVLDLLEKQGIAKKDVQTSQMQFGSNRVYKHNEWIEEGYVASTEVSFKLTDLGLYKGIWLALSEQSGVSVKQVEFDTSKRIELRKETRRKALLAAKEKAVDMAGVLGSKIGEPLFIAEDANQSVFRGGTNLNYISNAQSVMTGQGGDSESGMPLAPGMIPIRISVQTTFRLLNGG